MDNNIVLITIVVSFIVAILSMKFYFDLSINIAVHRFIIPELEERGYTLIKTKTLTNLLRIGNKRGHFDNVYFGLFDDTKYNSKIYINVIYTKDNINQVITTARIYCSFLGLPEKVVFRPDL